jgi:hypothetical protein
MGKHLAPEIRGSGIAVKKDDGDAVALLDVCHVSAEH